jgi:uncharacterized protein (TIRG00374 family)
VKKILNYTLKTALPIVLGAFILYMVYDDFDFSQLWSGLKEMNLVWFMVSVIFGIMSHVIRGWRWKLTLAPLGYNPSAATCVDSVYVAYAANLVLPRVGEVSRCAVLTKYDGVPFSKALGTLVAERLIDMLLVLLFVCVMLLTQLDVFLSLFAQTGTNEASFAELFSSPKTYAIIAAVVVACVTLWIPMKKTRLYAKVKQAIGGFVDGLLSLKTMNRKGLFLLYTIGIWVGYFLEFYLAFFCFPFTAELTVVQGLVIFAAISLAIVIPTPNGAGPWHFVVISMMTLYGVSNTDASSFALIVHTFQTLGVIMLGAYGWVALQVRNRKMKVEN